MTTFDAFSQTLTFRFFFSLFTHLLGGQVDVPPLGKVVVRLSIGCTCLSSMEGNALFSANDLRVTKTVNIKGGIFWFPEDHFDLIPLPSTWMGSFNLDLEARSRAVRNERRKKRKRNRKKGQKGRGGNSDDDDDDTDNPAETERKRVVARLTAHEERLAIELRQPEQRTHRQSQDLVVCRKSIADVQSTLAQQSQAGKARVLENGVLFEVCCV